MFLIEDNLAKKKMLLFIKCPALAFGRKSTVTFKTVCNAKSAS